VLTLFACCNAFVVALNIGLLVLYIKVNDTPTWIIQLQLCIEGMMWLIVVCVLGIAGVIVFRKIRQPGCRVLQLLPKGSNQVKIALLLGIIMLSYLSRVVFSFVSAATTTFFDIHNGISTNDIVVFFMLLAWEVVPLSAVLILFGSVSASSRRTSSVSAILGTPSLSVNNTTPNGSVISSQPPSETDPFLAASFFRNDTRYDSNDENDEFVANDDSITIVGAASPYRPFSTGSPSVRGLSGPLDLSSRIKPPKVINDNQ
jgi:hypothetical protein